MTKQIGYFHLAQDTVFRNTFEFAAWYEDVNVKAGKYPIEVTDYRESARHEGNEVDGYIGSAYVTMPGTIVSDYFASHYFGMPISDYDTQKNAGKKSMYRMHVYLYEMAHDMLDGSKEYELFPEYEAREIHFTYDGEKGTTYGLFRKE